MLRYPGGKLRLMKRIDVMIRDRYPESDNKWFVLDAFTGGGGSLINMAIDFPKWEFHINDKNPEVFRFWRYFSTATASDLEAFFDRLRSTTVTLDKYYEVFDWVPVTDFDVAFKIFFLNKTSYGGYITQRLPIGGAKQTGGWKVDCYWNPENMIRKIKKAHKAIHGKIRAVTNLDAVTVIQNSQFDFVYADPPYLTYGEAWYNCKYNGDDLTNLRNCLGERWCVSIDNIPQTTEIFKADDIRLIDVTYTAKSSYSNGSIKKSNEIVVFPR